MVICLYLTGSYCPEASADPTSCPDGTFGSTTGLGNVTQCTPCTPGFYCQTPGLTATEGGHFSFHFFHCCLLNDHCS